jgi:uncharacterized protein (DUF2062 family)
MSRLRTWILGTGLNSELAARSVAVGIGSAFLPFPGVQTPFLIPITWLLRAHLPIAYTLNWISNPATLVPLAMVDYHAGKVVLTGSLWQEGAEDPFRTLLSWSIGERGERTFSTFPWAETQSILPTFFLGGFLMTAGVSALTYVITRPLFSWLTREDRRS